MKINQLSLITLTLAAGLLLCPARSYAEDKPPVVNLESEFKSQLLNKTSEVFTWVQAGVEKGADFVAAQTPLLIQEILRYNLINNIVYLVVGIVFWLVLVTLFFKTFISYGNTDDKSKAVKYSIFSGCFSKWLDPSDGLSILLGSFIIVVLSVLFNFMILNQVEPIIKITCAPRLYLLEYAKDLTK